VVKITSRHFPRRGGQTIFTEGVKLTRIQKNRVVITGMGVITPLGLNLETTWEGLIAGKSGINHITLFDASGLETQIAGEVKGFQPTDYISRKDARHMDRFAQLAVAASIQALDQSGIKTSAENECDIGIVVGSGIGGLTTLFEQADEGAFR
jgi:3-oxoacyl-[acyl-carrier-protein] synthase II